MKTKKLKNPVRRPKTEAKAVTQPNTNYVLISALTALNNANIVLGRTSDNLGEIAKALAQGTTFNDALVTLLGSPDFAKAIGGIVDRVTAPKDRKTKTA